MKPHLIIIVSILFISLLTATDAFHSLHANRANQRLNSSMVHRPGIKHLINLFDIFLPSFNGNPTSSFRMLGAISSYAPRQVAPSFSLGVINASSNQPQNFVFDSSVAQLFSSIIMHAFNSSSYFDVALW